MQLESANSILLLVSRGHCHVALERVCENRFSVPQVSRGRAGDGGGER